jgi:2-dehydropantoate 2-reductase
MNVAIIGIGAMGCLFAARLAPLANVTLLGHWPEQLKTLQTDGLTLIETDGSTRRVKVRATDNLHAIEPAAIIFALVKSYQTEQAAELAGQLLADSGVAITLQNGLGNLEKIIARVGCQRALQGATTEGATLERPGVVRHAGHGITYLAKMADSNTAATIVPDLLRRAGFETVLSDDVDSILWNKLAVNAAINPLTALLRVRNGYLLQSAAARTLMHAAAEEVQQLAAAQDIILDEESAGDRAEEVARATARNRSSMLQDVLNGRPTEMEAITGSVVRLGKVHHVSTPVNEALLALLQAQEAGRDWRNLLPTLPISDPALRQLFATLTDEVIDESM